MVTHTWSITEDMVEAYRRSIDWNRNYEKASATWTIKEQTITRMKMEEFFRGLSKELKKKWEDKCREGMDVTEELKELLQAYIAREKALCEEKGTSMNYLVFVMKKFILAYDAHEEASNKLEQLKYKLATGYRKETEEEDDE